MSFSKLLVSARVGADLGITLRTFEPAMRYSFSASTIFPMSSSPLKTSYTLSSKRISCTCSVAVNATCAEKGIPYSAPSGRSILYTKLNCTSPALRKSQLTTSSTGRSGALITRLFLRVSTPLY